MKCPKCGYLGFEHVERCKNCGYRFSLSTLSGIRPPELPLRAGAPTVEPLGDLELVDAASTPPEAQPHDVLGSGLGFHNGAGHANDDRGDLPLFTPRDADDAPLITRASPPRAPLAVRRATPEIPRLRTERAQAGDTPLPGLESPRRTATGRFPVSADGAALGGAALGLASRTLASVVDLALLAIIDLVVVYLTMQIGGVTWADRALLPIAPLVAFLVVQNLGYLVAFGAGGQTLGQMALGVKVVDAESGRVPGLSPAFRRTLVWLALLLPAGLGLLTILAGDRRGLHDRISGTRVERAG